MPPENPRQEKEIMAAQARQVIDVFHEISTLLNADLDRQTLSICISLIENGVNPEALATVVKELRKDAEETNRQSMQQQGNGR
ncbi:mitotic-spindle organizing protein 1 [Halenospora varia]|nr:mitotic-spindle organizing protein 1 [Halenospora varia]